jgi:methionyl-tRNA formyltransferase
MRIVFIGSVEFSVQILQRLISLGAQIVGVCTLAQSKLNSDHVNLSGLSEAHGIPWCYAEDINSGEVLRWIKNKGPDVIFCFGWSRLVKRELLDLAPMGVLGFHAAQLPANRGRHPIIWSLVLGLRETASTFFFMDEGADSGDIISQRQICIDDEDDAFTLYEKVTYSALEQIEEVLPLLSGGICNRIRQDSTHANAWRKRSNIDGVIDWRMSARSIHNLVRGLTHPYIGAHFILNENEIKVWKTAVVCGTPVNMEPGKVLATVNGCPVIKCGQDAISLLATDPVLELTIGGYL